MKKALLISMLVVVGLSVAAFAGPLSGEWCTSLRLYDAVYRESEWVLVDEEVEVEVLGPPINVLNLVIFSSVLELDYTTCGWTFSSTADFNKHHFANLYFEAQGSVGAFGFYGILDFIPQSPSFGFLIGFVDVSIAGVNLYGGGGIRNFNAGPTSPLTDPAIGVGWVVGGYGVAGDCAVWVEAQFNFDPLIGDIYDYGYETMIDQILYTSGYSCQEIKPGYNVVQSQCCACWVGLDVYVEYSFACFDVLTTVAFDCEVGFDEVCFMIDDICTGLDWLLLDDLNICFNLQTKSVCGELELVLADCVCFTPYVNLVMDGANATITGIEINALTVEYDMGQGVTFKAGTFFDTTWGNTGFAKVGPAPAAGCDSEGTYCWDSDGNIVADLGGSDCCLNNAYDEYFAVLIDGDACCGGAFAVEVYNWFDDDLDTAFMDWAEAEIDISIGIGSNTTLTVGLSLVNTGFNYLSLGVCFAF